MGKNLEELRQEIDQIDRQMVELFKARMETVGRVSAYKKEQGLPVYDADRERVLLNKIADQAGEVFADYAQTVYRAILSTSRAYQETMSDKVSENGTMGDPGRI